MTTAHCVVTIPDTVVEKFPVAPKEVVVRVINEFLVREGLGLRSPCMLIQLNVYCLDWEGSNSSQLNS